MMSQKQNSEQKQNSVRKAGATHMDLEDKKKLTKFFQQMEQTVVFLKIKDRKFQSAKQQHNFQSEFAQNISQTNFSHVWSNEQEALLFQLYQTYGAKWCRFTKQLPLKTENMIKNKFYGCIRKLLRKINSVGKIHKKIKKPIQYQAIMRPLQTVGLCWNLFDGFQQQNRYLQKLILTSSQGNNPDNLSLQECFQIIDRVHKFNMDTRCFSIRKSKRQQHTRKRKSHNKETIAEENQIENTKISYIEEKIMGREQEQENQDLDFNKLLDQQKIESLYKLQHPHYLHQNHQNSSNGSDYVQEMLQQIESHFYGEGRQLNDILQ